MPETTYRDFHLTFGHRDEGGYTVEGQSPDGGTSSLDFELQVTEAELASLHQETLQAPARDVSRPQAARRRRQTQPQRAKTIGERLYKTVFAGAVKSSFDHSLAETEKQGVGLRIRLRLGDDVPDLAVLPWEYLYSRERGSFFALQEKTPIVRSLRLKYQACSALYLEKLPLNILVMISNPECDIEADKEWNRISKALERLTTDGLVKVDRLPKATLKALRKQRLKTDYHVFHFIGHGDFIKHDDDTEEAVLILEGHDGEGEPVRPEELRDYFGPKMRLVILNSCEGGRTSRRAPYVGVAQSLVQRGIPAVVAMQFKITDKAAIEFADMFYDGIAHGCSVERCLAGARLAIRDESTQPTEWGTPVLFLQSETGQVFQLPPEEEWRQYRIDRLAKDAKVAIDGKDYAKAIEKLNDILKISEQPIRAG